MVSMRKSVSRLYLDGVPSAQLRDSLVNWLEQDQQRIVCILQSQTSSHSFHPRVRHFCVNGLEGEAVLREIAWEGVFLSHDYMQIGQSLQEKELLAKLQDVQREIHLLASDFSDFGVQVARNLLDNLSYMEEIYLAYNWKGALKGTPAIICGAGPSLEQAVDELRTLQNQALLFSGGAGLTALEHFGILPHFAGAIDPFPSYERLQLTHSLDLPFFFQGRMANDLLKQIRGPKIWVEPSGHFSLDRWIAGFFALPAGMFDGGWNVVTFLTAIACHLGCNPIAVIGVDPLEDAYAAGLIEQHEQKKDRQVAAKWLEEFAAKHPQVQFSLKGLEAVHSLPSIKSLFRGAPHKLQEIDRCRSYLIASTFRVRENCEQLIEHWNALLSKEEKKLSSKEYFLCQFELEEEIAYQVFCRPVWEVWQHVLKREIGDKEKLELHKWLFIERICHSLLF